MGAKKIKDIVAKTGEYTDNNGNNKGRYVNVGSLMESDDGSNFIIMERTFNPAGLANPENRSSVLLSCFDPNRERGGSSSGQGSGQSGGGYDGGQQSQNNQQDLDDEIPF